MLFWKKLWKMWENIEIHNRQEKKLFSSRTKLSYYKIFYVKSISNRNGKTQMSMNKPVYLGLSILDLSKTVMYELWYNYLKQKYGGNVKLCCMDINSFIVHVKTDDIYKDNTKDVEKRFDTLNYEIDRSLPKEKNEKSNWANER